MWILDKCISRFFLALILAFFPSPAFGETKQCSELTREQVHEQSQSLIGCAAKALFAAFTGGKFKGPKAPPPTADAATKAGFLGKFVAAKDLIKSAIEKNKCSLKVASALAKAAYDTGQVVVDGKKLSEPRDAESTAAILAAAFADGSTIAKDALALTQSILTLTTLKDIAISCAAPTDLMKSAESLGTPGVIIDCGLTIAGGALMLGRLSTCAFQALQASNASAISLSKQLHAYASADSKESGCATRLYQEALDVKGVCCKPLSG